VIHPIPSGTRDVLPDEMRELRAITEAIRGVFESRGYGEIATPALEYETVLTRGDARAADPAYKLFDEHGNVLVLRSDMTIPIARVVATRYAASEPPLRFCYFAHAYRSVRPQRGQAREMLQAGLELVGAPGPDGTAEALGVLCAGLLRVPQLRGGVEVLEGIPEAGDLRAVHDLLEPSVADRVIFDLGLIRDLGYYTGAVFEVYDAALGAPMGGGGRYDDLLGRFGRELPACGWALNVERLHLARVGEGR
jgi:ATP phosphoribosyltransferase regulatory subunit